nr:uncharacterized protein LOC113732435 isoform X2 [Coffea arabica]
MEEKLKQQKTASASIIVIQGLGQGIIAPPPCPSRTSSKEEQKKPRARAAAGDQEGKQPEHSSTASDVFSDYITGVKNKTRTPSNVSEETVNASQFARLATRRDSFNDKDKD